MNPSTELISSTIAIAATFGLISGFCLALVRRSPKEPLRLPIVFAVAPVLVVHVALAVELVKIAAKYEVLEPAWTASAFLLGGLLGSRAKTRLDAVVKRRMGSKASIQ